MNNLKCVNLIILILFDMKYQKLQFQMTRFHDDIRPRYLNPTFVSSNVGITMGSPMTRSYSTNNLGSKNYSSINFSNQENTNKQSKQNNNNQQQNLFKSNSTNHHRKSQSNLSNYGVNSLVPLRKQINEKDIYQKQQKKYNIVTIQPKEYVDTIKIFPKYRLQNIDENYYKKIMLQNQISAKKKNLQKNKMNQVLDKKLDVNPQLNQSSEVPIKPFRGKLLNNIDQLTGII